MSKKVTPIQCTHQHLRTKAEADAVRDAKGRITAFRLNIEARCEECGTPFHFPNYIREDDEKKVHNSAVVSRKCTRLTTPIVPGAYAPEDN